MFPNPSQLYPSDQVFTYEHVEAILHLHNRKALYQVLIVSSLYNDETGNTLKSSSMTSPHCPALLNEFETLVANCWKGVCPKMIR